MPEKKETNLPPKKNKPSKPKYWLRQIGINGELVTGLVNPKDLKNFKQNFAKRNPGVEFDEDKWIGEADWRERVIKDFDESKAPKHLRSR